MGGKAARRKGAAFERYVVQELRLVWPDVRRGRQYDSARECDVEGAPFRTECKHTKTWPDVEAALAQCRRDGDRYGDGRVCVAITKRDFKEPRVTFGLSDFVKFAHDFREDILRQAAENFRRTQDNVIPFPGKWHGPDAS